MSIVKGNKNLFYLTGFQRSGTTLLCHLLDKHPDIVCAEEPEISKRLVYGQYDLLRDVKFDSIKKSLDFYNVPAGRYLKLVDSYLSKDIDADTFLRAGYGLCNNKGATWVGAKEVMDLTAARCNYLNRLLDFHHGTLKIVFIERDIKGVVNSFIKLGFSPPGKKWTNTFYMKRFARKYIKILNRMDQLLQKADVYFFTYESFLKDPREQLHGIYDFLGVDASENVLNMILNTPSRGIRNNYNGVMEEVGIGWEKNLTGRQAAWLDKLYTDKRRPRVTNG